MKALIDGDIIPYEFGNAKDPQGNILSWPYVVARINSRIEGILAATGANEYQIYVSKEGGHNFRMDVATILPYKGNRPSEKPHWWKDIRTHLIKIKGAIEVDGYEADDQLAIEATKDPLHTIICSRDKDLLMVPGNHYNWQAGKQKEKLPWTQDEIGGYRCFFKQMLTGDTVDNILGLYGVGPKSAAVSAVLSAEDADSMYRTVRTCYYQRFGSYYFDFMLENATLLWMLREGIETEAEHLLQGFEQKYEETQQSDL